MWSAATEPTPSEGELRRLDESLRQREQELERRSELLEEQENAIRRRLHNRSRSHSRASRSRSSSSGSRSGSDYRDPGEDNAIGNSNRVPQTPDASRDRQPRSMDNMRCEIVQKRPSIIKYYGRIGRKCQDLETWITSVDVHLSNLGWRNQLDILNEAKAFLDLSKGDIHNFASTWEFKGCETWAELKKYMRSIYGVISSRDPVIALQKMFREANATTEDYISYGGAVNAKSQSWLAMVNESPWADAGKKIPTEDMAKLIHLALILAHLPEGLVNVIHKRWRPDHGLASIRTQVEDRLSVAPNVDMSRIYPRETQANPQRNSVNSVQGNINTKSLSSASKGNRYGNHKPQKLCYNCQKANHFAKDCRNPPYCSHHKRTGHRNDTCRLLLASNQQQQQQQQRSQGAIPRTNFQGANQRNLNSNAQGSPNNRYQPSYYQSGPRYSQNNEYRQETRHSAVRQDEQQTQGVFQFSQQNEPRTDFQGSPSRHRNA